ncbi:MAG: tetratricopeptide repeat protein [Spirochaetia bacterium]|jgi:tetratricopeptide (TPR) repeat protein
MRKILLIALFVCVPLAIFAQDAAQFTAETDHYRVYAETSQAQAEDVAHRMEAALALYNDIFHFDLSLLPTKLRVRLFQDLDSFNAYLDKVLSQKRTDFVFIAWSDPERSELLCFPKEDAAFTASLLHQGCIQFMKAFIDNPPVWLREGVATYLDASPWDAKTGTFTLKPNLAWLEGLRAMIRAETPNTLISFPDLLTITRDKAQAQMDIFAPESWGLVQFLLNAPDRSYSRVLWDSLSALTSNASLDDNSQRARKRAFSWVTDQKLQQDFQAYILSLKTANDLVKDAIDLYTKGDLDNAEISLTKSLDLDPSISTAWYYLGLIAYARKDYAKAEDQYLKAFQLGANAGIINYALGVNSFAEGKNADAVKYLNFAKQADKAAYGDKVDALLKRIDTGK